MIPESPTESQAKALLDAMQPPTIGVTALLRAMQNANAGFVTWDATPPAGESPANHRNTLLDAFHTCFSFCQTDTRSEWAVVGAAVLVYVRGLWCFRQAYPPGECEPLVWVGTLRSINVYVPSVTAQIRLPISDERVVCLGGNGFYAGVSDRCCRGLISGGWVGSQEGRFCW